MAITGFERAPATVPRGTPALDESQRRVLDLPADLSATVIGAPGTGKTTTLVELVAHRILVDGFSPGSVLALTSTRGTATRLRDALALSATQPASGNSTSWTQVAAPVAGSAHRHLGC